MALSLTVASKDMLSDGDWVTLQQLIEEYE